ncbi:MAG: hypothetical protein IKG87_07850 [Clostridia bacterium]|nr:hypothetical protein [Clostridia bacterium]MBR3429993.1 hypothetical protein [Clostridia bacterium]
MAGYDMKELAKDMDTAIRELRDIRKEMVTMRRLIQKQQRLQFPLIPVEPREEDEDETKSAGELQLAGARRLNPTIIAEGVRESASEAIRDMTSKA